MSKAQVQNVLFGPAFKRKSNKFEILHKIMTQYFCRFEVFVAIMNIIFQQMYLENRDFLYLEISIYVLDLDFQCASQSICN